MIKRCFNGTGPSDKSVLEQFRVRQRTELLDKLDSNINALIILLNLDQID